MVCLPGIIDGHEHDSYDNPAKAGVAILDHSGNPRHPTCYHLGSPHEGDPYYELSYLGASLLMGEDMTLAAGESLRLQYRVVIFDGPVPAEALDKSWAEFSRQT